MAIFVILKLDSNNSIKSMKVKEIYQKLEKDFNLDQCSDDWSQMDFNEFICDNFNERYMGLVLDNTEVIEKVYTAVFPSDKVLKEILDKGENNILIFTHHPSTWDTTVSGFPFKDMSKDLLIKLKEKNISLYCLHVPLDANGDFSTTVNYAKEIGVSYDEDFAEYYGVQVGVIGRTKLNALEELVNMVEKAVGHKVKSLKYGSDNIANQKIAVVAGGGNDPEILKELLGKGIKTYVTGIVSAIGGYPPAVEFNSLAKENKINVIGSSHYSSEKFACIKMLDYFEALGIKASFVEDKPDLGDIV
jgi:putative NIF3 family GTP cyclohydrolase 1 type 2